MRPCMICGEKQLSTERWSLGYKTCMPCGEKAAKGVVRTIVPMHKSNYMMITDMDDLKGINNKGGLIK
jgi:ribosomal protein L37AE/L43A